MIYKKKRRIVIDILTIFVCLLFAISLSIITYSYFATSEAVLSQADEMIEHTHRSVIDSLADFLHPTPFLTIASRLMSDDILDFNDMRALTTFMHIILESYPALNHIYVADTHGDIFTENRVTPYSISHQMISFIDYNNIPNGTAYISQYVMRKGNQALLTTSYKNATGNILKTSPAINIPFDPRTRPWYIGATKTPTKHWIGLYKFFGSAVPGVTIASAVKVNNKLVGVVSADLSLNMITDQLRNFEISSKGTIYIVSNKGQIIAYEKPIAAGENASLPNINDIKDPILTLPYQLHQQSHKSTFRFKLNNAHYIAKYTPFSLSDTEQWEIATIVPTNVFIGVLKRTNEENMLFSLFMMGIGVLLVGFFSRKISRPIIRLAKETKAMTELQFGEEVALNSHIYEIHTMAAALNTMKAALSSFAKYVPKTLVKQLLRTHIIAELGGQKKPITVLFTDITNFTEITEQTAPEFLMMHISEYLNELTDVIQHYNGNIDKYIGDAIMAFWNAPLENRNHAKDACLAVLACQQHVHALNEKWRMAGKPLFLTRFGLNTGLALVGNMGSHDRINYTVLGDTVNLAARLEAINKTYGTEIIVSEFIVHECHQQFLFRPLDQVRVRGKHQLVTIYELMAAKSNQHKFAATPEQLELYELSVNAYDAYYRGNKPLAITLFKAMEAKFPHDLMAKIYLERCAHE